MANYSHFYIAIRGKFYSLIEKYVCHDYSKNIEFASIP